MVCGKKGEKRSEPLSIQHIPHLLNMTFDRYWICRLLAMKIRSGKCKAIDRSHIPFYLTLSSIYSSLNIRGVFVEIVKCERTFIAVAIKSLKAKPG